ncbi:hypothetical protein [Sphingomonas mesophila]|uniref:hypothetical protein n=1 Tax=Sphingomonas mesophila TaxID=2303576 RepID=UPI0030841CC2
MRSLVLVPALLLAACGDVAPLKPAAGQALPVKPALAKVTPDAEDLLRPTVMAAPERVDELVTRSLPREADRFDLPPPDGGASPPAPAAEAEGEDEQPTRVGEPE